MDIIAAEKVYTDLTEKQIDLLKSARAGVPLVSVGKEVAQADYDALAAKELVAVVNFEHPRANTSLRAVILTDDGEKVMQHIEKIDAAPIYESRLHNNVNAHDHGKTPEVQNTKQATEKSVDVTDVPVGDRAQIDHPTEKDVSVTVKPEETEVSFVAPMPEKTKVINKTDEKDVAEKPVRVDTTSRSAKNSSAAKE